MRINEQNPSSLRLSALSRKARYRHSATAIAVAACFGATGVYANPTNPLVVNGAASLTTAGNLLTITNTPNAIINWGSFSIGANEITRFVQLSASSAVLNRVVGQDPSSILGALQSNGRVFLINPNGILFGAGSQINVGGLVASTMNLANEDFLAGRMRFTGGLGNSVINQGNITTPQGGNVYLIGNAVTNNGIITSPKGEVVLAAGNSVELVNPGTPDLRVEVVAPSNQALNLGSIVAESGRVGIYAGLINQAGTINANSVVVGENGQITLKASKNIDLAAGSVTTANGPSGGKIEVQSGDTTLVSGVVEAKGQQLALPFGDDAGKGGEIKLLGNLVGLTGNARLDASGENGGGTVLVGGDFQGKNPNVQNAFRTYVGEDVSIKADAITSGNGGKVVVWGDDVTRYYGNISARGGAQAGNGGQVEVSGKVYLDFNGQVSTTAPHGLTGSLLLDPSDLTVGNPVDSFNGGFFTGNPAVFAGATGPAFITWATINAQLASNDVVLTTTGFGGTGDITVTNLYPSPGLLSQNLTFLAHNNFTVNAGAVVNFRSTGALKVVAGWDGVSTAAPATNIGTGNIAINADFGNDSGTLTLNAGKSISIANSLVYSGGVTVAGTRSVNMTAGSGNLSINNSFIHAKSFGGSNAVILMSAGGSLDVSAASTVKAETGPGGGTGSVSLSSTGGMTVQGGSTVTAVSNAAGGGAMSVDLAGSGPVLVDNSTISATGSTSTGGGGGGNATVGVSSGASITIQNSNTGRGIYATGGDGDKFGGAPGSDTINIAALAGTGSLTVTNSVVKGAAGTNIAFVAQGSSTVNVSSVSGNIDLTNSSVDSLGSTSGFPRVNSKIRIESTAGGNISIANTPLNAQGQGASQVEILTTAGGGAINVTTPDIKAYGVGFVTALNPAENYVNIKAAGNITLGSGGNGIEASAGSLAGSTAVLIQSNNGSIATAAQITAEPETTFAGSGAIGTVTLSAPNGAITSTGGFLRVKDNSAAALEPGSNITLTAKNGIGATGAPVRFNDNLVQVNATNTGTGDIVLSQVTGNVLGAKLNLSNAAAGGAFDIKSEAGDIIAPSVLTGNAHPLTNLNGPIILRAANSILVEPIQTAGFDPGRVKAGGNVTLIANDMDLQGPVTANGGAGGITIQTTTGGRTIDIGSVTPPLSASLGLSNGEIGQLSATTLTIGSASNPVVLSNNVTFGANTDVTLLGSSVNQTAGAITQTGGIGTLVMNTGAGNITANGANNFTVLNLIGGTVQVTEVDNITAILNTSGLTTINRGGNLTVSGNTAGLTFTGGIAGSTTTFGATTVLGALNANSGGAVTQTGTLAVTGATAILATGKTITLGMANDFQGTASFTGSTVQVNDANALNAGLNTSGASTLTAGGNLIVSGAAAGLTTTTTGGGSTSFGATNVSGNLASTSAGAVSQTGVLTVSGASSFNAGANAISLNQNNNFTGAVSLNNTGANNVVLNNAGALVLGTSSVGSGTLTVTAGGDITQTGPIAQAGAGAASFAVGGIGGVALTNAGNNFQGTATFSVTQGDVQVTDVDALTAVVIVGVTGTPLSKVQAGGALVVSGTTPGLKTITTGGAGSTTSFGATTVTGTGALDVTSAGAVSQTGVITTPNLLITTANANALLNTQTNAVATLGTTALGTGALNLLDAGGLTVAAAGVGATGGITLNTSGALAINSVLNAGTGAVSLTTTGAGNAISQTAAGVITAGNLAVTTTNANAVLTTATNFVSNLGPVTQGLGGMDLKNAVNLTFTGAVNNAGFLLNNTGTAAINAPINTGAGNLTLNSTGGITQNAAGAITSNSVAVTTTNANATLNAATNTVPNFGPANVGSGAVAFSTTGPLTITGAVNATGGIDLKSGGAMAINNPLAAGAGNVALTTTGGAITQTAKITGANLTANATGGAIALTNAANDFTGTATLANSGAFNVDITDANALTLGATTAGNNLSVTAPTGITLTGNMTSGGAQTYNNALTLGSSIVINAGPGNVNFNGFIDGATAGGQSLTVNSIGATNFNAGVGGGKALLSLTTDPAGTTLVAGPITTTGALTLNDVVGGTNLVLNAGAGAITAFNLANNFTGVTTLTGGTIQVANVGPMTAALTASGASTLTAGGNLSVSGSTVGLTTTTLGAGTTNFGATTDSGSLNTTSAGAVSQSGALLVSGNTDVNAGANPITLTNAGNDFAGPATFTGSVVQVTDSNALFATLAASGASILTSGGNLTVSGSAAGLTTTGGGTTTFGTTTVGGALSVSSLSGAVSQTNSLVVTGSSNINAGPNAITLTNAGNDFQGALSLSNSGANNVAITDANALIVGAWNLGTGTLAVNTNGAVTESGFIAQAAGAGAASFNVAGPITLNSANNDFTGSLSLTGAATQVTDKNTLTLGTLNTGALTVTSTGALNLGQGTVGGALIAKSNNNAITQTGALTVAGISDINAGNAPITLNNAGNDFIGAVSVAGSTVQITDSNTLTLGNLSAGSLSVAASSSVLQGALNTSGNFTLPSGILTINPGGSLTTVATNIAPGATLATGGTFTATGPVTVGGILKGSATGPILATGQPVNVNSGGTLDLNGGSVTTSAVNNQGLLKGVGTINGNVFNDGTFSPGASPGLVIIVGNYFQGPTGLLNIEIGGLTPGSGFDQLAITGNATLNGVLAIIQSGGFVPAPTDGFRFLTTGGTISGTFSTILVPAAFAGMSLTYQSQFTDAVASPIAFGAPGSATNQLIAATQQPILVVEEKKILTEEEKKKLGPSCTP